MRTYLTVSTLVFSFIAAVQLVRLALGWPVVVSGIDIPLWASAIAAVFMGSLAVVGGRLIVKTQG